MFLWECNQQQASIGSDNGLAQNRQQAIIWTNDDIVFLRIYVPFGLNELILEIRLFIDYQRTKSYSVYSETQLGISL